jgi:dTDP-4-dehydrorhamnose reductase
MGRKVAVLGGHGQLGRQLAKVYPGAYLPTSAELNITEPEDVAQLYDYDLVINCAAMHDLRSCEEDKAMALFVNAMAVFTLGIVCKRLIHISTNYVFSGKRKGGYNESQTPFPVNSYGMSKYIGEQCLHFLGRDHLIVRTAGLYGPGGPSGKDFSFADAVRDGKYTRIKSDEWINPTSCIDLARGIKRFEEGGATGVVHLVNYPCMTWYDFAKMIRDDVTPVSSREMYDGLFRPKFGCLSSVYDTGMMSVQEALDEYLRLTS